MRLSAIGDCCHTLPVVRTIQSAWPDTKITWIIGRTEFELMNGIDGVEFITIDKKHSGNAFRAIRSALGDRRFPLLMHMQASMRANFLSLAVKADIRLGFDRHRARDMQWIFSNAKIAARERQHVMDGLFGFAEAAGINDRVMRWDIPVADTDINFAAQVCGDHRPVCLISPCSSERARNYRNWPIASFVELIGRMQSELSAKVVLSGGRSETEREYGQAIEAGVQRPIDNLIGQTSLKQLLALIDRADALICPDSGPAHMATAVGTPVVGLYATSNRCRTGPWLSQHLVADRYPDAVEREFGRPVEAIRWGQRVRNPEAMSLITVAEVFEQFARALREQRNV